MSYSSMLKFLIYCRGPTSVLIILRDKDSTRLSVNSNECKIIITSHMSRRGNVLGAMCVSVCVSGLVRATLCTTTMFVSLSWQNDFWAKRPYSATGQQQESGAQIPIASDYFFLTLYQR